MYLVRLYDSQCSLIESHDGQCVSTSSNFIVSPDCSIGVYVGLYVIRSDKTSLIA